jgi:hypothetical protein
MALQFEDTKLGAQALAYVIELYRELTVENGAPTLGTQNQAVDFIRSDPELRRAVSAWAEAAKIDESTTAPRQRLPFDALYNQVRSFLERTMTRRSSSVRFSVSVRSIVANAAVRNSGSGMQISW